MWIDRVEQRLNDTLSRLPHPVAWIAGGVLMIVVLLVSFGSVAQGQVERSHARMSGLQSMRAELMQCNDLNTAMAVDLCRNKVQVAYMPPDRTPRMPSPSWPDAGTSPLQTGKFQRADASFVAVPLPVTQVAGKPLL